METRQQQDKLTKLLNEMNRAYTKIDRLTAENKALKAEVRKLKKLSK